MQQMRSIGQRATERRCREGSPTRLPRRTSGDVRAEPAGLIRRPVGREVARSRGSPQRQPHRELDPTTEPIDRSAAADRGSSSRRMDWLTTGRSDNHRHHGGDAIRHRRRRQRLIHPPANHPHWEDHQRDDGNYENRRSLQRDGGHARRRWRHAAMRVRAPRQQQDTASSVEWVGTAKSWTTFVFFSIRVEFDPTKD
ncbi:hypothetical protein Mal33_00340 [Rosistilla oblonga]|uniref:Uncharacterized protein n=1 Tax=Rosistilla oblonga TaxID=2527990 RepID=A0A518IM01_9BACT|nr:hypothetical protein Mal33_00340 [Rosistilla oblonga]